MAKKIGQLTVDLRLVSQKFTDGMNKAKASLTRLKSQVKNTMKSVGGMATGFAAAAGIAGMGLMIKNALKVGDNLGKMSDRLNVATQDLAAMQHLMELNGESSESLEKSLQKMARGIGEASRGFGTSKKALEELGIGLDDLEGKSSAEQFFIIGEAIKGVSDSSKQASFAADIFGRAGINLINTMQSGSEGFAQAKKEVELYGLALNRVEAKQIEEANDAIDRMQKSIKGVAMQATVALAPILQYISERFTALITDGEGFKNSVKEVVKSTVSGFGQVARAIDGIKLVYLGAKNTLLLLRAITTKTIEIMANGFNRVIKIIIAEFQMFSAQVSYIFEKIGQWFETSVKRPVQESLNSLINWLANKAESLAKALPDMFGDNIKSVAASLRGLEFNIGKGDSDSALDNIDKKLDKATEKFNKFKSGIENGEFDFKILTDASETVNKELLETSLAIQDIINNPFDPEKINEQIEAILEKSRNAVEVQKSAINEIMANTDVSGKQDEKPEEDKKDDPVSKADKQYGDLYSKEKSFLEKTSALRISQSKKVTAIQKVLALKETISTGFVAMQKAVASAPFPANIPAIALTTAQVAANIAGIRGQAHDGLDYVPREGTWLLDKGERVVDSRTNGDLKTFLSNNRTAISSTSNAETAQQQTTQKTENQNNFNVTLNVTQRKRGDILDEIESIKKPLTRLLQSTINQPI